MTKFRITAEQAFWRDNMIAEGKPRAEIADAFARRYELRPRTAFRHAHGWTLLDAVGHINAFADRLALIPEGRRGMSAGWLCDAENWPHPRRIRRISAYHLVLLAAVYGTDVSRLLDDADRHHLRADDRFLLGLIGDARPPSIGQPPGRPGVPHTPHPTPNGTR